MADDELPDVLRVEPAGEGRFLVHHPPDDPEGRNIVFSGQLLAQMIMAADRAVDGAKDVKSIHAIFARAATYASPLVLELDTMHGGRAWASHTITARQGDRLMARGMVLQNAPTPDLMRHAPAMPDVPGPDDLAPDTASLVFPGTETRTVPDDAVAPDGTPALYFWMRHARSFASVAANQAVLAWSEPGLLIGLAMRPHGDVVSIGDAHRTVSTGVISHTAQFHDRADVGDWLLVAQQATYAGRGQVFGAGQVFATDGTLVATFNQDAMARGVDQPMDPSRSM